MLAPSEIKSVSLIIIIYENCHGRNCLRTNAKRLSSSLLCEERASGTESYQIKIKKQIVEKWVKNKVNFVGDDLGNVIAWHLGKLKIENLSCIWRRDGFDISLHFIPSLQSAVCILYLVCILYPVCSLQSAVCSLHFILTDLVNRIGNISVNELLEEKKLENVIPTKLKGWLCPSATQHF